MKTTGLNTREKAVSQELYDKLKNKGYKDIEIAKKLGVTKQSLSRAKKNWGYKKQVNTVKRAIAELQNNSEAPVIVNNLQELMNRLNLVVLEEKMEGAEFKRYLYKKVREILDKKSMQYTLQDIAYIIKAIE